MPPVAAERTESEVAPISEQAFDGPRPAAFQWSQLESTNYWTYVANLRSIGCPEQTIRDIVAADLDSACYSQRREALQRLSAAAGTADSPAVEAEAQQLGIEESALLARLLQPRQEADEITSGRGASSLGNTQTAWISPAIQPGAASKSTGGAGLQPLATSSAFAGTSLPPDANHPPGDPEPPTPVVGPKTLNLAGNVFSGDSGPSPQPEAGIHPDPAVAALLAKWELARRNADYSLRGLIGSQRYLEYLNQQYLDNTATSQ